MNLPHVRPAFRKSSYQFNKMNTLTHTNAIVILKKTYRVEEKRAVHEIIGKYVFGALWSTSLHH